MKTLIREQVQDSIMVKQACLDETILSTIEKMAVSLREAFQQGKKILLFGNGGSASDAQHIAAEFVGRFKKEREALPAIALPCNASNVTAIGNDYGFGTIFSRQVEAFGEAGDVALGISTSGNSKNVVRAFEAAQKKGMVSLGWTGSDSCAMDDLCSEVLHVASKDTARIQECHIMVGHILCALVEQ